MKMEREKGINLKQEGRNRKDTGKMSQNEIITAKRAKVKAA
jgi:hypothetical protein